MIKCYIRKFIFDDGYERIIHSHCDHVGFHGAYFHDIPENVPSEDYGRSLHEDHAITEVRDSVHYLPEN